MISDRATTCPHCGLSVKDSLKSSPAINATNVSHSSPPSKRPIKANTYYEEDKPKKTSKALIVIVIVLTIIATGFGVFLYKGGMIPSAKPELAVMDSAIVADTIAQEEEGKPVENVDSEAAADTMVVQTEETQNDGTQMSPQGQREWTIRDTSGPTNIRESPRGNVCLEMEANKDFLIYTDSEDGNWLRISSIYCISDDCTFELHGSDTGEYWIFKNVLQPSLPQ